MNKLNFTSKNNGDVLNASEWNAVVSKTDELVQAVNDGAVSGGGSGNTVVVEGDSHVTFDSANKHNLTIATTAADQYQEGSKTKGGKINIEPISDLQIKSGDDIIMCSHHREDPTEVSVKIHDGKDHPVKLQMNVADIVLTTKDKNLTKEKDNTGADTNTPLYNDPAVLNVTVNSAKDTRGYLKVRAQAIDLRSESHGGIALQPNGSDSDSHMNKIKFEHGGGDGLEFGTFNAEKTSIFTDEYRFNKDGVWKMATRQKLDNSYDLTGEVGVTIGNKKYKAGTSDETQHYSYKKQADDFYDIITPYNQSAGTGDEQCTTKDIIKTSYAMNGTPCVHTKVTKKGALEISTSDQYLYSNTLPTGFEGSLISVSTPTQGGGSLIPTTPQDGKYYSESEFKAFFDNSTTSAMLAAMTAAADGDWIGLEITISAGAMSSSTIGYIKKFACPDIKIDSGAELKLGGILDFGSSFAFGETDNGIEFQLKKTKKDSGTEKDCGVLKVHAYNNHASNNYAISGFVADETNHTYQTRQITLYPGTDHAVGSCSVLDIIKFVAWAKATQFGPWGTSITSANGIVVNNVGQVVDQGGSGEFSGDPAPSNP